MEETWEAVVIGAGAAGLMAALRAAERGKQVLLLEKNRKAGVKILMSGGTRCNITHDTNNRGIVEAYGHPGKFLHSALAAFSVQDTLDFFHAEGVATKVEETGKIFPVSNRALDVQMALLHRLQRSGAILSLGEPVVTMGRNAEGFSLSTPQRQIQAEKVILTSGGQSYPGSGTTGDGYRFAAQFGHTIVPPRPALVPINVRDGWVAELRGVTLGDVGVQLLEVGKVLDKRRGSMLFAHFGLTGPVILDISRFVSGHPQPQTLLLQMDLFPGQKEDDLKNFIQDASAHSGKKQLGVVLGSLIPRRLADTILNLCGLPLDRIVAGLRREDRQNLVNHLKRLQVQVQGTLGFAKAEVTAGGVSLKEVDSRNMQSKLVENFFLAGEVLDLDGPIGGYNFQAAWSTGWLAGSSV